MLPNALFSRSTCTSSKTLLSSIFCPAMTCLRICGKHQIVCHIHAFRIPILCLLCSLWMVDNRKNPSLNMRCIIPSSWHISRSSQCQRPYSCVSASERYRLWLSLVQPQTTGKNLIQGASPKYKRLHTHWSNNNLSWAMEERLSIIQRRNSQQVPFFQGTNHKTKGKIWIGDNHPKLDA